MKRSIIVLTVAVLLLPAIAAAQPRQSSAFQTEQITRALKIGDRGELLVSNLSGDIVVTRGSGSEVRVEAIKTARGRTDEEAREMLDLVEVTFTERGSRAEVKAVYPDQQGRRQSGRRNVNVSVAYSVSAPENTRLSLRTLSGDVTVTDVRGEISAASTSGDITVRNAGRIATARSTSGDVEITDTSSDMPFQAHSVSGDVIVRQVRVPRLDLSTISGDVRLHDVQAERVNAQTVSGDVDFGSPLAKNGRYSLKSHSGDVRITVTGNAGFELDANSFSGTVRSGVELKNVVGGGAGSRRGRERSLRGVFGDGSALLDVTTFSGSVVVSRK